MSGLAAGLDPAALGMWVTFAVILAALVLYKTERVSLELTSLGVICALLVFFNFAPVPDAAGANILDPTKLLAGFANPALLTVVALLVMGEGLARTGILEAGAQMFFRYGRGYAALATGLAFIAVLVVSGFMNNTPVVVIFIPIMQALASRLSQSPTKLMMPLSFASPIGYQTNLLVMAPGNYRFADFLRVGTPLLVIVWLVFSFVAPKYYGLS